MCPTQAGFVPRYGRRGLGQLAVSGEEGAVAIKNSKLDFLGCLSFVWRLSERLGLESGGGEVFFGLHRGKLAAPTKQRTMAGALLCYVLGSLTALGGQDLDQYTGVQSVWPRDSLLVRTVKTL